MPVHPRRCKKSSAARSYCEADEDIGFLQSDTTRGVRLQLDYLKTESLLEAHDVAHTIVVFGSTRILEPQAARRDVERCTKALAANTNDPELAASPRRCAARRGKKPLLRHGARLRPHRRRGRSATPLAGRS